MIIIRVQILLLELRMLALDQAWKRRIKRGAGGVIKPTFRATRKRSRERGEARGEVVEKHERRKRTCEMAMSALDCFEKVLGGVNGIITREPDEDYTKKRSGTPLWWAARAVRDGEAGGVDLARLLMEKGADVNAVGKELGNEYKYTPLRFLAEAVKDSRDGAPELLRLFVSRGATLLPSERAEWQPYISQPVSEEVRYLRELPEENIPKAFLCPITHEVMNDPHIASDGHTYERDAIERWFRQHRTSPVTNEVLSDHTLRPNHNLRSMISEEAMNRRRAGGG